MKRSIILGLRLMQNDRLAEATDSPVEPVKLQVPDSVEPRSEWSTPQVSRVSGPIAPCPQCGHQMVGVRGRKDAICGNCGFKDSCCY